MEALRFLAAGARRVQPVARARAPRARGQEREDRLIDSTLSPWVKRVRLGQAASDARQPPRASDRVEDRTSADCRRRRDRVNDPVPRLASRQPAGRIVLTRHAVGRRGSQAAWLSRTTYAGSGPGPRALSRARGAGLLRPPDGHALRELQRRDLADPARHRPAFQSIYAFCRWSDDLGDEVGDPRRSLELLTGGAASCRRSTSGHAAAPGDDRAGARPSRSYQIPIDPFEALISAFEQDQTSPNTRPMRSLLDYCTRRPTRSATWSCYVAGAFTHENARLSDATCTALQLANFWQDVARDLAIGRIYLPREDRERFGYPESDLRALRFTPAFAGLMRFEVDRTRALFAEGRLVPRISGPWPSISTCSRGAAWRSSIGSRLAGSTFWRPAGADSMDQARASRTCLLGLGLARMHGRQRMTRTSSVPAAASRDMAAATIASTASRAPARPMESPQ